jgi:predicted dehydrogenase
VDRGLHVFVEKPFTMNRQAGEEILARQDGTELVTQVGYVNRFNEVFQEVKSLLDAGILGKVADFRSEMYGRTVLSEDNSSWRGRKESGGGVLYDLGSHCIDLAVYLMGKPERVFGSTMQSIYSSDVEDIVTSTFVYNSGMVGTIKANWSDESYRKAANLMEIVGTRGKIIADRYGYRLYLREANGEQGFEAGWNHRSITDIAGGVRFYLRGNEFTNQLDHFIQCIEDKNPVTDCTLADAFIVDCLMEEIRKDATGAMPSAVKPRLLTGFDGPQPVKKRSPWAWLKRLFGKERC